MSTNHELKFCLVEFLSNKRFSGYEFKDIRLTFISSFPQFSSKKYYAKIYQTIRELVNLEFIILDSRTCTYKYTTNYKKEDLLQLLEIREISHVKDSLNIEYEKIIDNIIQFNDEIKIYKRYLEMFPTLINIISKYIEERITEIKFLKCELKALKKIIDAI